MNHLYSIFIWPVVLLPPDPPHPQKQPTIDVHSLLNQVIIDLFPTMFVFICMCFVLCINPHWIEYITTRNKSLSYFPGNQIFVHTWMTQWPRYSFTFGWQKNIRDQKGYALGSLRFDTKDYILVKFTRNQTFFTHAWIRQRQEMC
mgnify:CR=1 FL=1